MAKNILCPNKKSKIEQNHCGNVQTLDYGIDMANNVKNETRHIDTMIYN